MNQCGVFSGTITQSPFAIRRGVPPSTPEPVRFSAFVRFSSRSVPPVTIGGRRVEIRGGHEQRAWSKSEIRGMLREAGLHVVDVVDFDPFDEADALRAPTVKLFFTCGIAEQSRRPRS